MNVRALAKYAVENNSNLLVTGYADSATGNVEHNQWLSERRAETVAGELEGMGVQSSKITTRGLGPCRRLSSTVVLLSRSLSNQKIRLIKKRSFRGTLFLLWLFDFLFLICLSNKLIPSFHKETSILTSFRGRAQAPPLPQAITIEKEGLNKLLSPYILNPMIFLTSRSVACALARATSAPSFAILSSKSLLAEYSSMRSRMGLITFTRSCAICFFMSP